MNIHDKIVARLQNDYQFKQVGEWLRQGKCPNCGKKELYTHARTPRMVKCGRLNRCGYEAHVKELYGDMFIEWSKEYVPTHTNPNAAADAYLWHGRGLNTALIRGSYTQEHYYDRNLNAGSATVRFALPDGGYWERLIDKPERFPRKANLKYGYSLNGQWWWHPKNEQYPSEIWIAEGIFDACALAQSGLNAVSPISCVNFPSVALEQLKQQYHNNGKPLPTLVFAYDNDKAGRDYTKKAVKQAQNLGFHAVAAQPSCNARHKLDWCDLLDREQLTEQHLQEYRYYGDLLVAPNAIDSAVIRYLKTRQSQFYFEHSYRTYWFALDTDKLAKLMDLHRDDDVAEVVADVADDTDKERMANFIRQTSTTTEILNAKMEALYFQRNEVTDESWYFVQITTDKGNRQATLTGEHFSSPSKLKPRLLSVYAGVLWTGNAHQLDILIKRQIEGLKEVKTTDFIGYSKEHGAYIFSDVAISRGEAVIKNEHDYFNLGKLEIKSLAQEPKLIINTKDTPDFSWWHKFYRVRGTYGLIVLAWWLGSYFAEQIRAIDRSYPFFELVGQAGAGKSRLIEFLWRLSGRNDYEGFDPTKSTNVATFRNFAQVSNLPVCLIEGDRNDESGNATSAKTFIWDSLKDAFNGRSIRSRGIKNNGNETYSPPFRAAIMISQNEEIRASEAMLTRIIHIRLTREGQTYETKEIVDELDRLDLDETSTFIAHALKQEKAIMETYVQKIRLYEKQYHISGITHTRIALNHAQIAALVDCLYQHVLNGFISREQVALAHHQLRIMASERVNRLSADHPDVEKFWSVFDYLNMSQSYTNHKPVWEPHIAINLNHFYAEAKRHYQDLPDITTMKRLLKSSSKYRFLDSNVSIRSILSDFKVVKCWLFVNPNPSEKPSNIKDGSFD